MRAERSQKRWLCCSLRRYASRARHPRKAYPCTDIAVVSTELSHKEAERYCKYAAGERKKVEKSWGPSWRDPIRIQVSSQYPIANTMVTTGGKPGNIQMPLDRVRDRTGALLHEISIFFGIVIRMYHKEHEPRHFHAEH